MIKAPKPNEKLKKAFREYGKQETLEELAEKYSINEFPLKDFEGTQWNNQRANCKQDFLAGAKAGVEWSREQDKNKYSEEEVINAFNEGQALNVRGKLIQGKEWFEQFKKK